MNGRHLVIHVVAAWSLSQPENCCHGPQCERALSHMSHSVVDVCVNKTERDVYKIYIFLWKERKTKRNEETEEETERRVL